MVQHPGRRCRSGQHGNGKVDAQPDRIQPKVKMTEHPLKDPVAENTWDVIVVGAGFAGLYMLHRLKQLDLRVLVIEAGSDVGGTWYWNRYPGARCDVESLSYSYSFDESLQQEWRWPDRYAVQPDILRYAQFVARRFSLYPHIVFDTRIVEACYTEPDHAWRISTDAGVHYVAGVCIMATGCLSVPKSPDIHGIDRFRGRLLHTANWPREALDFSRDHVGVIGTGSSAVQSIPILAEQSARLTVFQRTPNFSIPAWNGPLSEEQDRRCKDRYPVLRNRARNTFSGDFREEGGMKLLPASPAEREKALQHRWEQGGFHYQYGFTDAGYDTRANEIAAEFVRNKIRRTVADPEVAERLCPRDHPFGTKRLCVDTGYYETYNRANVELVDLKRTPVEAVTARGIVTTGMEYDLDTLVLATGFDAMTGALVRMNVRGRNHERLRDRWQGGASTYLGLMVANFPNLFMINGPGSPSVLCNMMLALEQHVEWISDCIEFMGQAGHRVIEASPDAERAWTDHVNRAADRTLYPRADSWYVGANVPGKARVFMPYVKGFKAYSEICDSVVEKGYEGFVFA